MSLCCSCLRFVLAADQGLLLVGCCFYWTLAPFGFGGVSPSTLNNNHHWSVTYPLQGLLNNI